MVHAVGTKTPVIDDSVFIAWNAEVAGDVRLGAGASVWFSAAVRGDIAAIEIGERSNIQDCAVVHVDTDVPCVIGADVTVGHGAILHSCVVGDGTLIGMGAIVLNGAEIGAGSIVGAGALVTQGKKFPPRSLIIGSPAKVARGLGDEEVESSRMNAAHYVEAGRDARRSYREIPRGG
jgi:carbonic anhydrase/acetyltransferase-like protein (isoleucine patch superfamily)